MMGQNLHLKHDTISVNCTKPKNITSHPVYGWVLKMMLGLVSRSRHFFYFASFVVVVVVVVTWHLDSKPFTRQLIQLTQECMPRVRYIIGLSFRSGSGPGENVHGKTWIHFCFRFFLSAQNVQIDLDCPVAAWMVDIYCRSWRCGFKTSGHQRLFFVHMHNARNILA